MTYSEKLRDPRWQKKRLEVMERDGFCCQRCGDKTKTLNVHHLKYSKRGNPWDVDARNLVTLCERCHESAHCPDCQKQRQATAKLQSDRRALPAWIKEGQDAALAVFLKRHLKNYLGTWVFEEFELCFSPDGTLTDMASGEVLFQPHE